ncbi:MAG: hypothetical protein AAF329_17145, partial [Cyanobacteria bacterium P01_A01_bin.17]
MTDQSDKDTTPDPFIHCPDTLPKWEGEYPHIERIVIGKIGETLSAKDWNIDGFAWRFPNLKCLHLWGLEGLEALPALPEGLTELDLRGCSSLKNLPELPKGLELIDLKGCTSLGKRCLKGQVLPDLMYLHVDGCKQLALKDIEDVLNSNISIKEEAPRGEQLKSLQAAWGTGLKEFTAEGCDSDDWSQLTLPEGSYSLRKLVLTGCSSLTHIKNLEEQRSLHHLNINGCKSLKHLGRFYHRALGEDAGEDSDMALKYFTCDGCPEFTEFLEMDVRSVHRSDGPKENVAETFKMLQRTRGDAPSELLMSKVLFLGSGRCGKTSTSKVLRDFARHGDASRFKTEILGTQSTDGIDYSEWETDFIFESGVARSGVSHIWDFGGQELYHNTHRFFASEGSVFVIATTSFGNQKARVEKDCRDLPNKEKPEFREQNEYREIKYWLDYLLQISPHLEKVEDFRDPRKAPAIHIVYTGESDTEAARRDVLAQAGPYRQLIQENDITLTIVDWKGVDAGANGLLATETAARRLLAWTQRKMAKTADELGIRVPSLVKEATAWVMKRKSTQRTKMYYSDFEVWQTAIAHCASSRSTWGELVHMSHARAIGRHLHNCGRLFWVKSVGPEGHMIYNQRWSVDLMYGLLERGPLVQAEVRKVSSEPIPDEKLKEILERYCSTYLNLEDDDEKDLFLNYLERCQICIRLGDGRWVVVTPVLTPEPITFMEKHNKEWQKCEAEIEEDLLIRKQQSPNVTQWKVLNHSFVLTGKDAYLIGQSDFAELVVSLSKGLLGDFQSSGMASILFGEDIKGGDRDVSVGARDWSFERKHRYRSNLRLWRRGIQIYLQKQDPSESDKIAERLMLRIEWKPLPSQTEDAKSVTQFRPDYAGGLFVELLCSNQEPYGERLEKLLFGEKGPLNLFADHVEYHCKASDIKPNDYRGLSLSGLRGYNGYPWDLQTAGPKTVVGLRDDVAFSYKGNQSTYVEIIERAIKKNGWSTYCYRSKAHEADQAGKRPESITQIYDRLYMARVLVIVLSEDYFQTPDWDGSRNLYCPVELVDAINATAIGYRDDEL